MPMKCTACCAATATCSARESARPTSSDARIDEPPRDEQRVFAAVEHAREPVDRRVGIAAANRLDERADDVVVRFAALVVGRAAPLHRLGESSPRRRICAPSRTGAETAANSSALSATRASPLARSTSAARASSSRSTRDSPRPRSSSARARSTIVRDLVVGELVEHEDARAGEQRRVDFERRILGGRADQRDRAVLDVRQHRVLLRFVEAMDLVDEQDGAPSDARARCASATTRRRSATPALTAESRSKCAPVERAITSASVVFPVPGGPHRIIDGNAIAFDRAAQRASGTEDRLLTDELVERSRTHSRRERRRIRRLEERPGS